MSETELLAACAGSGREAAFRELVERHAGMVRTVAMRRLGRVQDAEEVAQAVFVALAGKAGTLKEVGSLGAWLHRAAVLECRKALRTRMKDRKRLEMIREQAPERREESAWRRVREEVDEAVEKLSREEREVLMLHYVEGRTFAETAARLKTSAEAARKRCSRALEKLAGILRRQGVAVPAGALGMWLGEHFAGAAGGIPAAVLAQAAWGKAAGGGSGSSLFLLMTMKAIGAGCFALGLLAPFCWELGFASPARGASAMERQGGVGGRWDEGSWRPRGRTRFDLQAVKQAFERLDAAAEPERWQEAELRKLMFALDREELEQVLGLFGEVRNRSRFEGVACAFFARLAELDGAAAVMLAMEMEEFRGAALRGAFMTWAAGDEEAALAWMKEEKVEEGYDLTRRWLEWKVGVDAEGAGASARAAAAIFPERRGDLFRELVREWVKTDAAGAAGWSAAEGDARLRDELLAEVVRRHGELGGAETLEYAGLIADEGRRESVLNETLRWTGVRGGWKMMRALQEQGFGEVWSDENVRKFSAGMMVNRPDQLAVLLEIAGSEEMRQRVYEGVLEGAMWTEPPLVADAAAEVSEAFLLTERGTQAFGNYAKRWAVRDREGARAWMDGLVPGVKKDLAEKAWREVTGTENRSEEVGR